MFSKRKQGWAYEAGYKAFNSGLARSDNPYLSSPWRASFYRGFDAAALACQSEIKAGLKSLSQDLEQAESSKG